MTSWRDGRSDGTESEWSTPRPRIESPLGWSMPFGRIARIEIRLHLLLPLLFAIELLRSWLGHSGLGPLDTSLLLAALLLSVLLHELGHCFACRRLGGTADEVLLWPLGGLAGCHPPHDWASRFWTAAAGPLVNLAIALFAAGSLAATGAAWMGTAIPHPLHPGIGLEAVGGSVFLRFLFLLGWINTVLLLLNLVPMLPLDGGQMLQALIWRRRGAAMATAAAVRVGYASAVALGAAGLVLDRLLLVGLAVVGGLWCWQVSRQLWSRGDDPEEAEAMPAGAFGGGGAMNWSEAGEAPRGRSRSEERRARRGEMQRRRREAAAERERQEVDRILAKIGERGLRSLTLLERWRLRQATRRRRTRR